MRYLVYIWTGTEEEWLESLKQISYNDISDKPTLEGVTIEGEKGFADYNLNFLTNLEIEQLLK